MASTSPACREAAAGQPRWRRCAGLRLRPVPELEICLVYRRRPPRLFRLSPEPALLLVLAGDAPDGRGETELRRDFAARWPAAKDAEIAAAFLAALALLRREGLVEAATTTCVGAHGQAREKA